MGRNGSGKTTTGIQIASQIVETAGIPMLFIDPKGEFVDGDKVIGALADIKGIRAVEVGRDAIPLDFLTNTSGDDTSIAQAAMQFRDSIALCGKRPGDVQLDLLRAAVSNVIRQNAQCDLEAVRESYRIAREQAEKPHDGISSRLNDLTQLRVFTPKLSPSEFFAKSWVISLKSMGSDELKNLVILLILDSLRVFVLSQQDSAVVEGYRTLRHLLVIDEARRILANKKYQ